MPNYAELAHLPIHSWSAVAIRGIFAQSVVVPCIAYALPTLRFAQTCRIIATVFECLNDLQIKEKRRDCLRNRVYGSSTWQLARHEETITAKYKQTFAVWERCFRTEAANYIPMAEVVCPSRLAQGFTKA